MKLAIGIEIGMIKIIALKKIVRTMTMAEIMVDVDLKFCT